MKKTSVLLTLCVIFSFISTQNANAARIPFGSYEKLVKTADLPQNENYTTSDNKHFDLGAKYTVFQIAYVPIYQEGETQLIGYIDGDNYLDLSKDDIKEIAGLEKIEDLDSLAKLPFWDAWGGKLVLVPIIALIIYGMIPSKKNKEENKKEEETKS